MWINTIELYLVTTLYIRKANFRSPHLLQLLLTFLKHIVLINPAHDALHL